MLDKQQGDLVAETQTEELKREFPGLELERIDLGDGREVKVVETPPIASGLGARALIFTPGGEVVGLTKVNPHPNTFDGMNMHLTLEDLKALDLKPVLERLEVTRGPNQAEGFLWHDVTTKQGDIDVRLNILRLNLQHSGIRANMEAALQRTVAFQAQAKRK